MGFQILEDWAHNTTLSEAAIDGERGVVLEELRLRLGAQERMQKVTLPKMMYGSKYAKRLPIGTKEVLENFNYDDVRNYYKTLVQARFNGGYCCWRFGCCHP